MQDPNLQSAAPAGLPAAAHSNPWGDSIGSVGEKPRVSRRRLLAALVGFGLTGGFALAVRSSTRRPRVTRGVLPGEFERQDAILFSWSVRDDPLYREVANVIKALTGTIQVIVLTTDESVTQHARKSLRAADVPLDGVRFMTCPVNLPWVRDFGPLQIKSFDGDYLVVDTMYDSTDFTMVDMIEDEAPATFAKSLGLESIQAPIVLLGGNLQSNGAGLCVTSTKTIHDNAEFLGLSQYQVSEIIREYFGGDQVVFLEPLDREPTKHVDMFATFVAHDTIVIGQYDPDYDEVNAAILDENARRLAEVRTVCGPLKVKRIPMPPRHANDDQFWTYTNVVYANDAVVVPTYPGVDPKLEAKAHAVFQELLPMWRIVPVASEALMVEGGGLHCATMNVFRTKAATQGVA